MIALVTFPAASKRSVVSLTNSGCWLISAIPPALSAIGPSQARETGAGAGFDGDKVHTRGEERLIAEVRPQH